MPIETNKPFKICPYCKKEVQNLGQHISNIHPGILDQLNEMATPEMPSTPSNTPQIQQNSPVFDIDRMIYQKLNTMLNLKIIDMMTSNPGMSIKDIKEITTPPEDELTKLERYHKLFYKESSPGLNVNVDGGASDWIEIAKLALPVIGKMIPERKMEVKKDEPNRRDEREDRPILKPIYEEIAGDPIKSGSNLEESGISIQAEQPNYTIPPSPDPIIRDGE